MSDQLFQMRRFIEVTSEIDRVTTADRIYEASIEPELIEELPNQSNVIISELNDMSFKLRAFMESEGGDYALGVETGMQKAAEMIDNLIRRHSGDDVDGTFLRG